MNKFNISISLGFILTVLLFYYVISTYQASVPGSAKWLIKGKLQKAADQLAAAQTTT